MEDSFHLAAGAPTYSLSTSGVLGNDVARCIAVIEALRDDHCAATQQDADQQNHCHADGSDGCEFVAAWNEAIERLRTLGVRATTARSGADNASPKPDEGAK